MAIKAATLINYLNQRNGFAPLDEAFMAYRAKMNLTRLPIGDETYITALWDFLDDCRGCQTGFESQGMPGFIVVSFRRRVSALGDAADAFPERIMPDDNRPKSKERKPKVRTPEEQRKYEALQKKLAEQEKFVPGLMLVDENYWLTADLEKEAQRQVQTWLDEHNDTTEDFKVNSARLGHRELTDDAGTVTKVPGVWVTVFIPNVVIKRTDTSETENTTPPVES